MCKFLSYLLVSILLLGVASCTETEKVDLDVTLVEDKIVEVSADENIIVSVGESKFTMQHVEWMQPNTDPKLIQQMAEWWVNNELLYAEAIKQGIGDKNKTRFLTDLTKKQLYAKELIEKTQNAAEVSDDEILAHYEENKNTTPGFKKPTTFDFVHIQANDLEDANAVVERIQSGEDAEEVAKRLSIARDASKGGVAKNHMARTVRSRFGDEFLKAISAAEVGEVVGPIKLKNGTYEVVVLTIKTPASIKNFEEVKEQIKMQLTKKAKADAYKNLIEGVRVEAEGKIVESEMLKELKVPAGNTNPNQ